MPENFEMATKILHIQYVIKQECLGEIENNFL